MCPVEPDRGELQVVRANQNHETAGETAGRGVRPAVSPAGLQAEREFTAYFFDTDAGGVVHNLAYLRWVEAARTDLAEKLGWGIREMLEGEHGCPVLTKTEAEYLRPARLEGPFCGGVGGSGSGGGGFLPHPAGTGRRGPGHRKAQALARRLAGSEFRKVIKIRFL
ncbi:MAG: acyl-CoA thioesterase [Verrucomicrobia bacterium]|nr:acyl-CoA thioesterase [Verrucomicrobiota bacterium]